MIKNIIRVLLSNIVVLCVGFFNGLMFPRILSIDAYAFYQTFLLYISYIGILSLGFPSGLFVNYGGKSYENQDKRQIKSEILFLLITQSIFTLIFISLSVYFKNIILFYAAICIIPVNIIGTYKFLYQSWNQFKKFSLINSIIPITTCILMLIFCLNYNKTDGRIAVFPYIIVNIIVCIIQMIYFIKDTINVKSNKVLSSKNIYTLHVGFLLMIGSAANTLLGSLDRFFIKVLFKNYEFAMYSFAISMQSMMIIFITAVSQPLYPKMASDNSDFKNYSFLKELLMAFGSLSGCAYFVCSIIVKLFIPQYIGSLDIISIFFAVFPALAVINCLYINLYKVTKQIKKYLFTLVIIIFISFIINFIAVNLYKSYLTISFATTFCYYIWFWYSSRHFENLFLSTNDILYLIGFFILFFISTRLFYDVTGFFLYFICITLWISIFYKKVFKRVLEKVRIFLKNK